MDVVALYVDQKPGGRPERRAGRAASASRSIPTIAEALRCGGSEAGRRRRLDHRRARRITRRNEKGQILYPRYEFFREVAEVFETDGRAVPVFNDKHLSYSFAKAKEMVEHSKRLKFPFLAGSSLPVTWRLPPVELPLGCEIEEALMVGVGRLGPDGFPRPRGHAVHGRAARGGETGVEGRADHDRRRRLEGRRGGTLVPRACWRPPSPAPTRSRA